MTVTDSFLESSKTSVIVKEIELPLIHQKPYVFAVPVALESNQPDKFEKQQINPVATPNGNLQSEASDFEECEWWLKGVGDEWYPFDECILELQQYKNMRERIYGAWVNVISSSKKWNFGDAVVFSKKGLKKGPTDKNWKIPLWMRAQPYSLACFTNPFLNGIEIECTDSWFNKTKEFTKHRNTKMESTLKTKHFLVVKPVKSFSPKVVYKRNTSTTSPSDIVF